jgi:hypothetical protein
MTDRFILPHAPTTIRVSVDERSPWLDYIFDFIGNSVGCRFQFVDGMEGDVYYGDQTTAATSSIVFNRSQPEWIWKELLNGEVSAETHEGAVTFDIIHAIGSLLRDEPNRGKPTDALDSKERLMFTHSYQVEQGLGQTAIVDIYIQFLRGLIEKRLGVKTIPLWPEHKRCAVGLSHDVDIPDRFAILRAPFFSPRFPFGMNVILFLRQIKALMMPLIGRHRYDFWCFEETIDIETRAGFTSTFFFAPTRKASADGTEHDVDYDMHDERYASVVRRLAESGFDVSLHAGYGAFLDVEQFRREKADVESISGVRARGLRHHCWHVGSDVDRTLAMHEDAGFAYDSSVAFNDGVGLRRNTSLPFYPWNESRGRALHTLQLPVLCMDGALFRQYTEAQPAFEHVVERIEAVKKAGGMAILNWHSRNTYPKNELRVWGETYVLLLEWLATQDDLWVSNLAEIAEWITQRESAVREEDSP